MSRRKVVDDKAAHGRRVFDGDVHEKIVSPTEEEHLHDLGHTTDLFREGTDAFLTRPGRSVTPMTAWSPRPSARWSSAA